MKMNRKTVLVTGAGGGSGEAIAKEFLSQGAIVVAADLKFPAWECETEQEARLIRKALDISDEKAVESLFIALSADGIHIDSLVNNAGVAIGSPIENMSTETWDANMKVNAYGTFFCTRAAVRDMLSNHTRGSIVNVASIAGKNGFPNTSAYCASKAAIIGMTRGLAIELGGRDITVNAICPGSVDTPMIQRVAEMLSKNSGKALDVVRKEMTAKIPTLRFQTPAELAKLAAFLCSDAARSINGESINLDGGVVRD